MQNITAEVARLVQQLTVFSNLKQVFVVSLKLVYFLKCENLVLYSVIGEEFENRGCLYNVAVKYDDNLSLT